jgi:hypothetical protein
MIVRPDSGDPGLSSQPILIDSDHITIAKPANRDSEIYQLIRNFIKRQIERSISHEERKIDAVKDDTQAIRENVERLTAQAIFRQDAAEVEILQAGIQPLVYLRTLSDREIEEETQRLKKARYFVGFPIRNGGRLLPRGGCRTHQPAVTVDRNFRGASIVRRISKLLPVPRIVTLP